MCIIFGIEYDVFSFNHDAKIATRWCILVPIDTKKGIFCTYVLYKNNGAGTIKCIQGVPKKFKIVRTYWVIFSKTDFKF